MLVSRVKALHNSDSVNTRCSRSIMQIFIFLGGTSKQIRRCSMLHFEEKRLIIVQKINAIEETTLN